MEDNWSNYVYGNIVSYKIHRGSKLGSWLNNQVSWTTPKRWKMIKLPKLNMVFIADWNTSGFWQILLIFSLQNEKYELLVKIFNAKVSKFGFLSFFFDFSPKFLTGKKKRFNIKLKSIIFYYIKWNNLLSLLESEPFL